MPVRRSSPVLSSPLSHRTPLQHIGTPSTPRRCTSPNNSTYLSSIGNRKSSDSWSSWNSSNPDDEFEWKPEQLKFLSRTLDALPATVTTPFNGRVPPPNLLDKIARGATEAKGPTDWPHSVRATRLKLLELARARAREEVAERSSFATIEEEQIPPDSLPKSSKSKATKRRPLYRQSSMDFVNDSIGDTKDLSGIDRLSNRLKSNERTFANPSYQYPRALQPINRSTTPPRLLNPHTPSTSTLSSSCYDSVSSSSSRPGMRRRSASTLATSEASTPYETPCSMDAYIPPTIKTKRSDSVGTPVPATRPFKRAPSFGAIAQDARQSGMDQDDVSCASSDEEEKRRNTKKAKTKAVLTSPICPPTPLGNGREGPALKKAVGLGEPKRLTKRKSQRTPCEFGPELPQLSSPPPFPSRSPLAASSPATQPSSPMLLTPGSPSSPKVKTLRRVRRFDLTVARRISFSSNGNDFDEEDGDYHPFSGCTPNLGSAFQLL